MLDGFDLLVVEEGVGREPDSQVHEQAFAFAAGGEVAEEAGAADEAL